MRKSARRILSLAITLSLLCTLLTANAYADVGQQGERWNIMLVIDGSASLWSGINSDPDGMRYEAINSFLDTLHSDGHNVGAIVFNANQSADDSDGAMETGIYVNTGIFSLDSDAARNEIKNQVYNAPKNWKSTPQTDIGTALLVAARELQKVSDNGNRSAVFLFSDGMIEVNKAIKAKSLSNLQQAEEDMRSNDILFCGVFLNQGGKHHSEIRDIAYAANGISEGMGLGNHYIEITDAKSCAETTDRFMTLLGYSIGNQDLVDNHDFERSFRVPGIGVEEANIRLRTDNGELIPNGIEVSFTMPDGTTAPANEVASSCSTGKTYHIYKLKYPASGTWTVHVKVPEENKISIYYSPVFSFYVGAKMETDVAPTDMRAGQIVNAECFLMQNDQVLTDAAYYREYQCELVLTNINTGDEQHIEVLPNSSGEYKVKVPLGYGVYDAVAVFTCDQLSVTTEHQTWAMPNTVPTAKDTYVSLSYSFLNSGTKTIDLGQYISDDEDNNDKLALTISGGSCDMNGVDLDSNANVLTLTGHLCGSGTIEITVTDTQGASAQMTVRVTATNQTVVIILALLALLILAALTIVMIKRHQGGIKLDGRLTLDIEITDENGNEVSASGVSLKRPGNDGMPRCCTLAQLVDEEIKQEFSSLRDALSDDEEFKWLNEFVSSTGKSFLQSIRLSPERIKEDGKKVTALRVSVGRDTDRIYNSTTRQLSGNGAKIKLRYIKRAESGLDLDKPIEDDGFDDLDEDEGILDDVED